MNLSVSVKNDNDRILVDTVKGLNNWSYETMRYGWTQAEQLRWFMGVWLVEAVDIIDESL